jgi:hypothetical protein
LRDRAIAYWLDEAEISWGDNLVQKINDGLARSTFVVVFISVEFATRPWPQAELSSALGQQLATGVKRVLPVVVGNTEDVLNKFPLLRSYTYKTWDPTTAGNLADELKKLLESS